MRIFVLLQQIASSLRFFICVLEAGWGFILLLQKVSRFENLSQPRHTKGCFVFIYDLIIEVGKSFQLRRNYRRVQLLVSKVR